MFQNTYYNYVYILIIDLLFLNIFSGEQKMQLVTNSESAINRSQVVNSWLLTATFQSLSYLD